MRHHLPHQALEISTGLLPCCTFLAEEMPLGNIKDNTIEEFYIINHSLK